MVHGISAISRIDSKGRVSIPVGLRYKLRLMEGSAVSFEVKGKKIVLVPVNAQLSFTTKALSQREVKSQFKYRRTPSR
ncbi:MAG: AbrB/MazE/SpoVT family DNA-binding domain-containing protein [Candidatus Aenigmarchaeota archaeon]|nr:AbrB/MazE/SpoVT family DNA-binding domain-containing protein [Candidatus Aenigmarchaeota archaeon]